MSTVTSSPSGTARCIAVGALVSLVSAGLWYAIVEITHHKLGLVASGIGLLVGVAMARTATANRALPVVGALLALLGCVVGDFLTDAAEAGSVLGASTLTVVEKSIQHPDAGWELFTLGFSIMDVLFWGIAAWVALRQIEDRVEAALDRQAAGATPGIGVAGPVAATPVVPTTGPAETAAPGGTVPPAEPASAAPQSSPAAPASPVEQPPAADSPAATPAPPVTSVES